MRETLSIALGDYPHTAALRGGKIDSPLFGLAFADIPVISRAFAPMVRAGKFDVSELAIATFLQARAWQKPLVLLPVVMAGRFQEPALLCRADSDIRSPADLIGRRVGVRAYSQTTGLWLRGVLLDSFGVPPDQIRWVTFEDGHVAEAGDPSFSSRAPAGKDLLGMLRAGEIDAAIVGNDMPDDPALRPVIADTKAAADAFWARHGVVPVNHMVVVKRSLAETSPEVIEELMRLFSAAKAADPAPRDGRDPRPFGRAAVSPAVALALRFAVAQGMLPREISLDEVWAGSPAGW
jgi:4,5-dihydroxyphthalate decarboxylase